MAVSILKRPGAYILSSYTDITILNSDDIVGGSDNRAIVRSIAHGFIDGDAVYIKSNVDSYNGFLKVDAYDVDYYYLQVNETGAVYIPYVKDATGQAGIPTSSGFGHHWNAIHLPIIYKLSNTLWPLNTVDTLRTISSVTDVSGYCQIVSSGDMTAAVASIQPLAFVKIIGATDDDLNGVWQVVSKTNDTTFVLEIPYSAANDTALTGASIHYYYNNYHVKVQIWGGLNNGHVYYAQEPYELLATIDLVPDADGVVTFSVHEFLKKQIAIKNNLLLGTLPNNLDAFTMFFIKYAEVYDISDGIELSQLAPTYTSDLANFEGVAVNAVLPFKNIYSGALSEYVTGDSAQKFLTLFTRPTIFSGKYFDLSYIFQGTAPIVQQQYYFGGVLQATTEITEVASGDGVYRTKLTDPDCDYDRVDVKVISIAPGSELLANPTFVATLFPWTNDPGAGGNWTWNAGEYAEVTISPGVPSDNLQNAMAAQSAGWFYLVYTVDPNTTDVTIIIEAHDSGGLVQELVNEVLTNALTAYTKLVNIAAAFDRIKIRVSHAAASPTIEFHDGSFKPRVATALTETKTIDIDCDCLKSKSIGFHLSWLNPTAGFDHWYFTPYADHGIEITGSGETEENVFPEWPDSYGEFADTIRKQTHRTSRRQVVIRSQGVSLEKLQGLEYIKTSPLVQIVNSIYDRRTVLVDTDSFTSYKEGQSELYTITFTISYTDDVPSQTV